jgi:condensin complex subunit 3
MNQALEDEQVNYEFIVGQLLLISKFLDYGDEVGRRQMFALLSKYFTMFSENFLLLRRTKINYAYILGEILMLDHIPEGHIESIVEVMKRVSIDERDFTRLRIINVFFFLI